MSAIPEQAFKDCRSLDSVAVAPSVTACGKGAFEGCLALTSVVVAEGVTVSAEVRKAFHGCPLDDALVVTGD